jgi:hypothetical protein
MGTCKIYVIIGCNIAFILQAIPVCSVNRPVGIRITIYLIYSENCHVRLGKHEQMVQGVQSSWMWYCVTRLLSPRNTVSCTRRFESSKTLLWKPQISGRWHCISLLSLSNCPFHFIVLAVTLLTGCGWTPVHNSLVSEELDTKRGKPDCCLWLVNMHFN